MSPTNWKSLIEDMERSAGKPIEQIPSEQFVTFNEEANQWERSTEERLVTGTVPNVIFEAGLTDAETERVEQALGFQFPPDLRAFLQTALPTGEGFPNWRNGRLENLIDTLKRPADGICFDVENNAFWLVEWGVRPSAMPEALERVRELVKAAPVLIPIYGHRYLPAEPNLSGNPVLSVHQADIIHYGHDLEDYLRMEFALEERRPGPASIREIRFWSVDRFQNFYDDRSGLIEENS